MNRIFRISIVIGVFALIFIALVSSSVKTPDVSAAAWNQAMLKGELDSPARHYIVYTDLMCPYCNYYAKNIQDNQSDFESFLTEHKIAYEVRVTDMLYEGSGIENSRPAAEAAYCAARDNRFWDFYHAAVSAVFSDYYVKGIGNSKTATPISDMTRDYWLDVAHSVDLSDTFDTCYNNHESVSELVANTQKAAQLTGGGLPYFSFGSFSTGGFDSSWDWTVTKQMLSAGLK